MQPDHTIIPSRRQLLAWFASAAVWPAQATPALRMPAPMLAREAPATIDPTGWLVSEKYDGVRARWNGRELHFRSGLQISAPAWFLAALPADVALDGELWLGRGRFEALVGSVRRLHPVDAEWRRVRYMVFDLPRHDAPFVERHVRLVELCADTAGPMQAVVQSRISGRLALQDRLQAVTRAGGEGLMLHRADAAYVAGRSDTLLKLKPLQDAEARVVGHVPGRGRLAGRLGALRVRSDEGVEFQLGTGFSDAQRDDPPALGSRVTYTYRGRTGAGVPRFASFLRVREPV